MRSPAIADTRQIIDTAFHILDRQPTQAEQDLRGVLSNPTLSEDRTLLARCWLGIAQAQSMRARYNDALASARKCCLLYCDIGDRAGEAAALITLGSAECQLHMLSESQTHLIEAIRLAQETHSRELESLACSRLARLYSRTGRYHRSKSLLKRGLHHARRARSPHATAHTLQEFGCVYFETGEIPTAQWYFTWGIEVASAHGFREVQALCQANLAAACIRRDDNRTGLLHAQRTLRLGEALDNPVLMVFALTRIAYTQVKRGRFRDGTESLVRALGIARQTRLPQVTGMLLIAAGEIYLMLDEYGRALECYERMLECYRTTGYAGGENTAMYLIGRIHTLRGMPATALTYHFAAIRRARELGIRGTERAHLLGIARAYASVRDDRAAAHHYQACISFPTEAGDQEFRLLAQQGLAELAGRRNDGASQIAHLREALTIAERQAHCFQQIRTLRLLAEAYHAAGNTTEAARAEARRIRLAAVFMSSTTRRRAQDALLGVERNMLLSTGERLGLEKSELDALDTVLRCQVAASGGDAEEANDGTRVGAPSEHDIRRHSYRVATFGSLRLWVDGAEVTGRAWGRKRARDLFALLLVRYRRPVTIDEIIELLWGGSTARDVELLAMNTIAHLRRVLEPNRTPHARSQVLPGTNRTYVLDLGDDASIDLLEFHEAVAEARASTSDADRRRLYRAAVDLHHDDLLKENYYTEWGTSERELLKDAFLEGLEYLGRDALNCGAYNDAASAGRRLLAADATCSAGYELLTRALRSLMRERELDTVHQQCRIAFEREYGTPPPAHLERMFSRSS